MIPFLFFSCLKEETPSNDVVSVKSELIKASDVDISNIPIEVNQIRTSVDAFEKRVNDRSNSYSRSTYTTEEAIWYVEALLNKNNTVMNINKIDLQPMVYDIGMSFKTNYSEKEVIAAYINAQSVLDARGTQSEDYVIDVREVGGVIEALILSCEDCIKLEPPLTCIHYEDELLKAKECNSFDGEESYWALGGYCITGTTPPSAWYEIQSRFNEAYPTPDFHAYWTSVKFGIVEGYPTTSIGIDPLNNIWKYKGPLMWNGGANSYCIPAEGNDFSMNQYFCNFFDINDILISHYSIEHDFISIEICLLNVTLFPTTWTYFVQYGVSVPCEVGCSCSTRIP